ncbi:MAG: HDOD domain-containing protein [Opitutae bacterium]|nr:HDOD domain-containing protein [Opitutae bacterium]
MHYPNMTVNQIDEYDAIIRKVAGDLPSIPLLVQDMMKTISDTDAASFALCDIIGKDQSIFSKILKIANSVEYRQGRTDRITDMNDAVLRIGTENVRKTLLSTSVLDTFLDREGEDRFKLEGLWLHSCGVAIACSVLSERFDCEFSEQAYACGLLHDLGKVIKIKFLKKEFLREVKFSIKNKTSLWFSEKALGHIQHDLIGSMIVEKWGISSVVENTTRWHHTFSKSSRLNVEDPDVHKMIDLVMLANHMVKELKFGNSGSALSEALPERFLKRNRMTEEEYEGARETVRMHIDAESENLAVLLNG